MISNGFVSARRLAAALLLSSALVPSSAHAQAPDQILGEARAAASARNHAEAVRLFSRAGELAPKRRREWLLEQADQLAFAGRPAEALPLYREWLGDPAAPQGERRRAERGLAFALLWSSAFEDAAAAWRTILDAAPTDAEARKALVDAEVGLARAAAARGANREAFGVFERAIALDTARRNDVLREYADQLAFAGEPARAVPLYREILARTDLPAEERARTTRNLAFGLLWSSDFAAAVSAWEPLVRANPADEEARKALADAIVGSARQAAERNRNADAAATFRRAIEAAPQRRQELLAEYADQLAYSGRPAEAIALYQEALRANRPEAEQRRLRRSLALALGWSGRFAEAIPALEAALRESPQDEDLRRALNEARTGIAGRPGPAAPGQQQATSAPGAPQPAASQATPRSPADAAIAEARAAAGRGANRDAAALFARALSLDPGKRREIGREYADQLAFSGEPAKAVPVYREVLQRTDLPANERTATTRALAFALLWSSAWGDAIEAWTPILRAAPADAEARKALSDAFVGAARQVAGRNNNAGAATFFRRAIDTAPDRRQELIPEYADQLAFSGQAALAVPLYREGLRQGGRPAAERLRLRRGLGFALLWSNQFREAVDTLQALVRENPRDADIRKGFAEALVGAARQVAGQGRASESASLFARAIAAAPARRQELLREYADQVLYSGQHLRAIPLYEEVLARANLTVVDRRGARLGLARAYVWSGQPRLGLPYYTAILQEDPYDFEARIGRGQALNGIAAHRSALVDFEVALQLKPGNAEGLRGAGRAETALGLHRVALERIAPLLAAGDRHIETLRIGADARRAMGRPDLAEDFALAILAVNPRDEGALRTVQDLYEERRPETQIEASHNTRSDGLRIDTLFARHDLTFDRGLVRIGPQARFMRHRGQKFPEVDVFSLGGNGRARLSDWFEISTSFFVNKENEPRDNDITFTHESTVSFIPSDVWRFDLTTARRYPDENPEVIVNDVFQNDFGGTIRYTPSYDLRVNLRGFYSTYTDGNERVWGQFEAAQRVFYEPDVLFGIRLTAFDFTKRLTNGYWNPDDYQSAEATVQSYGTIAEKLTYNVQLAGGYGWTNPGQDGPLFSADGRLTYEINRDLAVSGFANYLITYARTSSTDPNAAPTNDPFWRLVVGGQLRLRW